MVKDVEEIRQEDNEDLRRREMGSVQIEQRTAPPAPYPSEMRCRR